MDSRCLCTTCKHVAVVRSRGIQIGSQITKIWTHHNAYALIQGPSGESELVGMILDKNTFFSIFFQLF